MNGGLTVRIVNALLNALLNEGLRSLSDSEKIDWNKVQSMTESEILRIPNFGRKSLKTLVEFLSENGMRLAGPQFTIPNKKELTGCSFDY